MGFVLWEIKEEIGIITIDSPPVNALSQEVLAELSYTLRHIPEEVRVILITGKGEKAFVAGANIKEFPALQQETGEQLCQYGQAIFQQIADLNQPVIAAIDGFTLGGGLELALASDFRIATKKSTFGFPEVKLGIIPGYGGTQRLSRLIGPGKAKQLIFSGEMLSAEEAYRIGLIEEITTDSALEEAWKWGKIIAKRGPIAVQKAKIAIDKGLELDLQEGLALEARLFGEICTTEDKNEGVRAFFERREPTFFGK